MARHLLSISRYSRPSKFLLLVYAFSLFSLIEVLHHVRSFHVARPRTPLDVPFATSCQEPKSSGARENAVIVMLARNKERDGAVKSILSLENQFNKWFNYPVVFLNDEPFDSDFVAALSMMTSGSAQFEIINGTGMWGYPDWIDLDRAAESIASQDAQGIMYAGQESYHHMCRFNSGKFFDHPALKPYKWYWRIEPDVEFTCAITYDPFVAMTNTNKRYGFSMALWERGDTVPSLFRTVSDYKHAQNIPSTTLWTSMMEPSWAPLPLRPLLGWLSGRDARGDSWNLCHYWSNFEIADMDWFRSVSYGQFFDALDRKGGFYYERWGDAAVHSLAAALLLEPHQIHHFEDFGYVHDAFQVLPANAKGGQLRDSPLLGPGHESWDPEQQGGIGCRCKGNPIKGIPQKTCQNKLARGLR